jgi:hypothetical protein
MARTFDLSSLSLLLICISINFVFAAENNLNTNRGYLLYENQCNLCHNKQIHWQEKKVATDWISRVDQVDHWQNISGLKWSKNDTEDVSHYLDNTYYHF